MCAKVSQVCAKVLFLWAVVLLAAVAVRSEDWKEVSIDEMISYISTDKSAKIRLGAASLRKLIGKLNKDKNGNEITCNPLEYSLFKKTNPEQYKCTYTNVRCASVKDGSTVRTMTCSLIVMKDPKDPKAQLEHKDDTFECTDDKP